MTLQDDSMPLVPRHESPSKHPNELASYPQTYSWWYQKNTVIIPIQFYKSIGNYLYRLKQYGLRLVAIPRFRYILLTFDKNGINEMMQYTLLQKARMRKVLSRKNFFIEWNTIKCFIDFKQHQASNTTPEYYSKITNFLISCWHEIFLRLICSHLELETTMFLINVWAFSCYKISVCHMDRWIRRQDWKPFIMSTYLKFTLGHM